jgi:membrane protein
MLKLSETQIRMASRLSHYTSPWIAAIGEMIKNGGFELAGHLAFTAFLALFPFLIFLAALFGILGDVDTAKTLVNFLFRFAPHDVAQTLSGPIFAVMLAHHEDLLTIGILGTLWAASSWFEAMRLALNTAYDIEDPRPVWKRRLQSLIFVVISGIVLLIASSSIVLGPVAWKLVQQVIPVGPGIGIVWDIGRYILAGALFGGFLMILHQYLPPIRQRWRHLLPGILVTLVFWLAVSTGLSIYLALAGNYDSTYGTLGGVVITLLFFYTAGLVFIFGAELNGSYIARRKGGVRHAPKKNA